LRAGRATRRSNRKREARSDGRGARTAVDEALRWAMGTRRPPAAVAAAPLSLPSSFIDVTARAGGHPLAAAAAKAPEDALERYRRNLPVYERRHELLKRLHEIELARLHLLASSLRSTAGGAAILAQSLLDPPSPPATEQPRVRSSPRALSSRRLQSPQARFDSVYEHLHDEQQQHQRRNRPRQPPGARTARFAFAARLTREFLRHRDAAAFSAPITELWPPESLPGYFDIVLTPMDFRTILEKLDGGAYTLPEAVKTTDFELAANRCEEPRLLSLGDSLAQSNPANGREDEDHVADDGTAQRGQGSQFQLGVFDFERWEADMRLVLRNAMLYNRPGELYHEAARALEERLDARLASDSFPREDRVLADDRKRKRSPSVAPDGSSATGGGGKRRGPSSKTPQFVLGPDGELVEVQKESWKRKKKRREEERMSVDDVHTALEQLKSQKRAQELATLPSSALPPLASPRAGSAAAAAAAKRRLMQPMTFAEKEELGAKIGELPPESLGQVIIIASRRQGFQAEVNQNEEVELDILSMDTPTLREMEAYVNDALARKHGHAYGVGGLRRKSMPYLIRQIAHYEKLLAYKRSQAGLAPLEPTQGGAASRSAGAGGRSDNDSDGSGFDSDGSSSSSSSSSSSASPRSGSVSSSSSSRSRVDASSTSRGAQSRPKASSSSSSSSSASLSIKVGE